MPYYSLYLNDKPTGDYRSARNPAKATTEYAAEKGWVVQGTASRHTHTSGGKVSAYTASGRAYYGRGDERNARLYG